MLKFRMNAQEFIFQKSFYIKRVDILTRQDYNVTLHIILEFNTL